MELISIRLHRETVERLGTLARKEAARRDEHVTWAELVREAIEERLDEEPEWLAPEALAAA